METLLQKRISELEAQNAALNSQLQELIDKVDALISPNTTKIGNIKDKNLNRAGDINENLQNLIGAPVLWNTSEMNFVALITEPVNPMTIAGAKGFNKHTHSRFSGGALIANGLEIVDYDLTGITNIHSQGFWTHEPPIKTQTNSNGETVLKIGTLELIFNPDTKTWGVAALEIDVRKVNFVMRDSSGNLVTDSRGKSISGPLYSANPSKTSMVWDPNGGCWRFYAVYAPDSSQV